MVRAKKISLFDFDAPLMLGLVDNAVHGVRIGGLNPDPAGDGAIRSQTIESLLQAILQRSIFFLRPFITHGLEQRLCAKTPARTVRGSLDALLPTQIAGQ